MTVRSKTTKRPRRPKAEKADKAKPWAKGKVPIESLIFDDTYQMRAEPKDETEYLQDLTEAEGRWVFPPIKVVVVRGKAYVVDGFTRGRAAIAYSLKLRETDESASYSVPVLRKRGTSKEAFTEALGSNYEHGYRRTNADKRYAVQKALGKFPSASAERIAAYCKVSPPFVYKLRAKLANPDGAELTDEQIAEAAADHASSAEAEKAQKAIAKIDKKLGPCPNCGHTHWNEGDDGYSCAKCLHPHGEAVGLSGDEQAIVAPPAPTGRGKAKAPEVSPLDLRAEQLKVLAKEFGDLIRNLERAGLYEELQRPLGAIQSTITRERAKCREQASGQAAETAE